MVVRARRVVVAVPIAIASQIVYEPMLPVDRLFLHQRMPLGACFKIALVYDEPFWRADGLSGQSLRARVAGEPHHRLLHRHRNSRRSHGHHRGARSHARSASSPADERPSHLVATPAQPDRG